MADERANLYPAGIVVSELARLVEGDGFEQSGLVHLRNPSTAGVLELAAAVVASEIARDPLLPAAPLLERLRHAAETNESVAIADLLTVGEARRMPAARMFTGLMAKAFGLEANPNHFLGDR